MAFEKNQFRDLIIRTLGEIELYSPAATNLLLGTAAQESAFGTHLVQMGGGPAVGAFQMEPATFAWLQAKFRNGYGRYAANAKAQDMEHDLKLAIIMCRLRYYVAPDALPEAGNVPALAVMWKKVYNTPKGAGTIQEFIANYKKYVA
jgi:hypothetical protein